MKPEEGRNYLADLYFDADEGADRFVSRTGASLGKAYRDGLLWFDVHFATDAAQYCSVFKRHPGANLHRTAHCEHAALHDSSRSGENGELRAPDANRGFGQGVVLVKVAKFAEKPKRMTMAKIPSMVWLRPLDDCSLIRRKMSDHFGSPGTLNEGVVSALTRLPQENRKLGSPGALGDAFGNLSESDIKYRPKQNGNQTNFHIPLWIGGAADDQAYDLVRSVRIILKSHSVALGHDTCFDSRAQLRDFLISDMKLEDGAV